MPATGSVTSVPFWNVSVDRVADLQVEVLGRVLVDEDAAVGHGLEAARPAGRCRRAARTPAGRRRRSPSGRRRPAPAVPRTAVTADSSGTCASVVGDRRRQALERLVGDDVVGLHDSLEDVGERRAQRRGEHRGRADQGDADHQRRRRRRRAARRPAGVLPGQHARRLEQLGDRPADQLGRPAGRRSTRRWPRRGRSAGRRRRRAPSSADACRPAGRTGRRRTSPRRRP